MGMEGQAIPSRSFAADKPARRWYAKRLQFGAVGIVLLVLANYAGYKWSQVAGIESLRGNAMHRLEVFRGSFLTPIEKYSYLPTLLAAHPAVVDGLSRLDAPAQRRALNDFVEATNAAAATSSIFIMDQKGMTVASSNWKTRESFVGKNFSFRPYFTDAMQGKIGRFYGIGSVTLQPGYFISYGVKNDSGAIGVVAVKIDLDKLDERWDSGPDHIVISDDNGIIFLSSRREWKYRTLKPLSADVAGKLRETRQYASMVKPPLNITPDQPQQQGAVVRIEEDTAATASGRAQRYLVQSIELPEAKWTITMFSSMADTDSAARRDGLIALGAAAFLVLLFMYAQQFRKRIAEKEAARKAANIAHEKLEAKHKELEALNVHLNTMAISDPLTGVYNRRYFQDISAKMVSAAQRHRRSISLLMLDADFFKKINDTHGHPAGDEILKGIARACQSILREADVLARFGGEEFVIVLPDTVGDEARMVGERLRSAIAELVVESGKERITVTVSIGIAEFRDTEPTFEKALTRADLALYEAKRNGRNCVVSYSETLEHQPVQAPAACQAGE